MRPMDGFPPATKDLDIEKSANPELAARDSHSDRDDKSSYHSEDYHSGIKRVRAITEVWGKKELITMFIL